MRPLTVVVGVGLVVVGTGLDADAAPRPRAAAEFTVHERLGQVLRARGRRTLQAVEKVETRTTTLEIRVELPGIEAAFGDSATPVGLRIGDAIFETTLGSDPSWHPGRTRAHVVFPASDPDAAAGRLSLSFRRGVLVARGRLPGRAPYADLRTEAPSGTTEGTLDAALRVGGASVRFTGDLTGTVRGRDASVLGTPVHLATVRLAGTGRTVPVTEDAAAPQVTIAAPADGRLVPPGAVTVEGALRDDRTIARVTVALDDGAEVEAPFTRDPTTGYLDDFVAAFSVALEGVAQGTHAVTVRAYDAGGNVGASAEDFFAGEAPTDAFDAGDAENSGTPAYAVIDESGEVHSSALSFPTPVAGLQGSIAVATSPNGLFALQADGTVVAKSQGIGYLYGMLGNGTTTGSATPVNVTGLTGVTSVAAGGTFGMALRADGAVWTWGDNSYGQMGDGTSSSTIRRTIAAPVEGLPTIRSIGAHSYGAIAVDEDGFVWSWGYSYVTGFALSPTKVRGPEGIVSVAASSAGDFFLAVDTSGDVWSWGNNAYGQLGRGAGEGAVPAKVAGISGAKTVACGRDHSLVLLADGTLLAMGRDVYGTLGDGTASVTTFGPPFAVPVIDQVVDVDAGFNSSLALRADGTVWAWGSVNNKNVPTQVAGF